MTEIKATPQALKIVPQKKPRRSFYSRLEPIILNLVGYYGVQMERANDLERIARQADTRIDELEAENRRLQDGHHSIISWAIETDKALREKRRSTSNMRQASQINVMRHAIARTAKISAEALEVDDE